MATDGPDPPPCNPEIFTKGRAVFMTHTIPSNAMESWVKKVAARSEQPVDWHFVGGRAIVLTTGDIKMVRNAIEKLLPEHDELYRKAVEQYGVKASPPRCFFDEEE